MTPDEIRALRKSLNESQTVFGERFGVSQQTVLLWEKGRRNPSAAVIKIMEKIQITE